jgi:hypothetical protein
MIAAHFYRRILSSMDEDVLRRCLAKLPEFEPFENPDEAILPDHVACQALSLATLESGLPKNFKAGICLALSNVIDPKKQSPALDSSHIDYHISAADYAIPPTDPIERGYQIGIELTRIARLIRPFYATPTALVRHAGQMNISNDYSKVDYYKVHPDGFTITLPTLNDHSTKVSLIGTDILPPIGHRTKTYPGARSRSIATPRLDQLVWGAPFQPHKLLIGRDAIKFARQYRDEQLGLIPRARSN